MGPSQKSSWTLACIHSASVFRSTIRPLCHHLKNPSASQARVCRGTYYLVIRTVHLMREIPTKSIRPSHCATNGFLVISALTRRQAKLGMSGHQPSHHQKFYDVTEYRIKSYINNVHPILDHDVYAVANDLLSAFIPMLNSSLMHVKTSNLFYPRIDPEKQISREGLPDPEPGPYRSSESRLRSGKLTEDGKLPTPVRVDLRKEFWDNGIQAVIQVSSIELGEDRPAYPGEDWHVQGQLVSWRRSFFTASAADGGYGERTYLCYSNVLLQLRQCV